MRWPRSIIKQVTEKKNENNTEKHKLKESKKKKQTLKTNLFAKYNVQLKRKVQCYFLYCKKKNISENWL